MRLSNHQKTILRVIKEHQGKISAFYLHDLAKSELYPSLYVMRYELSDPTGSRGASYGTIANMMGLSKGTIRNDSLKIKEDGINLWDNSRSIKHYGDSQAKNAARASISRAIRRLRDKGLITGTDVYEITETGKSVNDVQNVAPLTT